MINIPKPPYKIIKEYLLENIKTGKYSPGEKIESENKLAEIFGVSRLTARKAVSELVQEGYFVRVQGMGTFVSHLSMGGRKPTYIGVVVKGTDGARGQAILSGILKGLYREFIYPITAPLGDDNLEAEREVLGELLKHDIQGLIFDPFERSIENEKLLKLIATDFPMVFVDREIGDLGIPAVSSNNFSGGKKLGTHLRGHGIRKVAFVTHEPLEVKKIQDRFEGFTKGFGESPEVFYIKEDPNIYHPINRKLFIEALKKIVRGNFDGIFFSHDLIAISGITLLSQMGKKVPEEIKVVGFDNKKIGAFTFPTLTTIRQDFTKIGEMAAFYIAKMVQKKSPVKLDHIPVELIVRESCGCKGENPLK